MKPWERQGCSRRAEREHQSYSCFVLLAPLEPLQDHLCAQWSPWGNSKTSFWAWSRHTWLQMKVLQGVRKRGRERSRNVIRNGRILRAWNLENRAPVHTGCVFRENESFEKTSRKVMNMKTQKTPKMEPKGSLGRSWGRLLRFWEVREEVDF